MLKRSSEKRQLCKCCFFLFCVECYLSVKLRISLCSVSESFDVWMLNLANNFMYQRIYDLPFLSFSFFHSLSFTFLSPFLFSSTLLYSWKLLDFLHMLVTPSHGATFQSHFDMGWSYWLIDWFLEKKFFFDQLLSLNKLSLVMVCTFLTFYFINNIHTN